MKLIGELYIVLRLVICFLTISDSFCVFTERMSVLLNRFFHSKSVLYLQNLLLYFSFKRFSCYKQPERRMYLYFLKQFLLQELH